MERTVPKTMHDSIDLYMRTYYSLLRSTTTVDVGVLERTHVGMNSSLHHYATESRVDTSALIYSISRLPACIDETDEILMGQSIRTFQDAGYVDIQTWEQVRAVARRRRSLYNRKGLMAVFIASRSDIDDLVPMLTAYQIEWNKIHFALNTSDGEVILAEWADQDGSPADEWAQKLAMLLELETTDLRRLLKVFGQYPYQTLHKIKQKRKNMRIRMVAGSLADYRRATYTWWSGIQEQLTKSKMDIERRPVYFVSSNTHALPNMLSGYVRDHEEELLHYVQTKRDEALLREYERLHSQVGEVFKENFLYFALKSYLADFPEKAVELMQAEQRTGIYRSISDFVFDVEAQVIDFSKLDVSKLDHRICQGIDVSYLQYSDAIILNIDYPLGLGAYELLNRVSEHVWHLLGVYVMGKAATLNARINDVMIPNVVHDEHSENTYLFNNCFRAADVSPYMLSGSVLDNQKAISAAGTFLQNAGYMGVFYREGFTDIEMEAGPYLSSIYESFRPKRHPFNEVVNLYGVPFDIGFLHYASDTPLYRGQDLSKSLSYQGVMATYATAIAILRRIMLKETERTRNRITDVHQVSLNAFEG